MTEIDIAAQHVSVTECAKTTTLAEARTAAKRLSFDLGETAVIYYDQHAPTYKFAAVLERQDSSFRSLQRVWRTTVRVNETDLRPRKRR